MKLSDYAKKLGMDYRTVWNWYKAGKIPNSFKTESGAIVVLEKDVYEEMLRCGQVKDGDNKRE